MKYKITPFNILSIPIIAIAFIYLFTDSHGQGHAVQILLFVEIIIGCSILILFPDFLLQLFIKKYKTIIFIEIIIIFIGLFAGIYQTRTQTLIIDDEFNKSYITIIYGVKNEQDLSISKLTFSKTIKIPDNGILLTSSDFEENLQDTEIKMESGTSPKSTMRLPDAQFASNGKIYKFRSWKIKQEAYAASYSGKELEELKVNLKKKFELLKPSR